LAELYLTDLCFEDDAEHACQVTAAAAAAATRGVTVSRRLL
jgi:hypothetical protein